jgi:NADPH2:quinone reductase
MALSRLFGSGDWYPAAVPLILGPTRRPVAGKVAKMRAAYYEANGPAKAVLKLGEVETPRPGPGDVRVKLATSGVNPSDVKARSGATRKIAYPRVIPHSDGAGEIDMVGDGISAARVGERAWVWNGQWLRPFGTCAEYVVLPAAQAVRLPAKTSSKSVPASAFRR